MFSTSATRLLSRSGAARCFTGRGVSQFNLLRFISTSAPSDDFHDDYDEDSFAFDKSSGGATEIVSFPSQADGDSTTAQPVLLNSKEHAVGYLGRVLNARVYEAAIETELQEAKNLSSVCICIIMLQSSRLAPSLNTCPALAKYRSSETRRYTKCILLQDQRSLQ